MIDDELDTLGRPAVNLPAAAAKATGWGAIVLCLFVGFVAWRKFRK